MGGQGMGWQGMDSWRPGGMALGPGLLAAAALAVALHTGPVLAATPADFARKNRRRLLARGGRMTTPLLTLEGVSRHYAASASVLGRLLPNRPVVRAVQDVSLTVARGEVRQP